MKTVTTGHKNVHLYLTLHPWNYISIILPNHILQRTFLCTSKTITVAFTKSHSFDSSPPALQHLVSSVLLHDPGTACLFHIWVLCSMATLLVLKGRDQIFCFLWRCRTDSKCLGTQWALVLKPLCTLFSDMTWNDSKCHCAPEMLTEWLLRDRNRVTSSSFLPPILVFSKHHGKGLALCFC